MCVGFAVSPTNCTLHLVTLTETRDSIREEIHTWKHKYELVSETVTEFHDSSSELEYEIENLRIMLREAREQKEKAISLRNSADRERDEALAKYEQKCREMERWEESMSSHLHQHGHRHGRSSTRSVVYRTTSGSTRVNGEGHSVSLESTVDEE